jgi:hypothetical protein
MTERGVVPRYDAYRPRQDDDVDMRQIPVPAHGKDAVMKRFMVTLVGLICALTWLVLLAATAFNPVTVSLGLLGAMMVLHRG